MEKLTFSVERKGEGEFLKENNQKVKVNFVFSDGSITEYLIYAHVVSVLRIASEILMSKHIYVETIIVDREIKRLTVNLKDSQNLKDAVKEAAEKRCSHEVDDLPKVNIIRQLPWKIVIDESNKIAKLGILHAIYASACGGYNIKVFKPYENPSLNFYCCYSSTLVWD